MGSNAPLKSVNRNRMLLMMPSPRRMASASKGEKDCQTITLPQESLTGTTAMTSRLPSIHSEEPSLIGL